MDVGGQALCTFQRIGAWAVAGAGALYDPARKASTATMRANATADLTGITLCIGIPPGRVGAFAAEKCRESSQPTPPCQQAQILLDRVSFGV
jgi:hypothetical protein